MLSRSRGAWHVITQINLTSCLPKLRPSNRPRKAPGAASIPSAIVSRNFKRPAIAPRSDDLADGPADHHLVERLRWSIALACVHPITHVRIQTEVMMADEHLPIRKLRNWNLNEPELLECRLACGARNKMLLLVHECRHDLAPRS
jgi:hypothetical protein